MKYFTISANKMFDMSLSMLGIIYYKGKYVKKNINKAIHYFTLAANQNDPTAQCFLGLINYEGKYVKQNIDKAIYYFTFASNQDRTDSQSSLGIIYYKKNDIDKSIKYFKMAAEKFDKFQIINLDVFILITNMYLVTSKRLFTIIQMHHRFIVNLQKII